MLRAKENRTHILSLPCLLGESRCSFQAEGLASIPCCFGQEYSQEGLRSRRLLCRSQDCYLLYHLFGVVTPLLVCVV